MISNWNKSLWIFFFVMQTIWFNFIYKLYTFWVSFFFQILADSFLVVGKIYKVGIQNFLGRDSMKFNKSTTMYSNPHVDMLGTTCQKLFALLLEINMTTHLINGVSVCLCVSMRAMRAGRRHSSPADLGSYWATGVQELLVPSRNQNDYITPDNLKGT